MSDTDRSLTAPPFTKAYDRLFEQRIVFLRGPLEQDNADLLVAQLLALDSDGNDPITMYINSPGGIISGLFAIHDTMHLLDSKVNTKCVGMAASAAAFLLATGTGTRSATENARIMIHQPLGGAQGTAKDIQIQASNILFLRKRLDEILAARTGQPLEKVQADTDRDYWLTADEAAAYGLIDQVLSLQPAAAA